MSGKTTDRKRSAKRPALLRNPIYEEKTSPAKLAVWTGHLQEEGPDAIGALELSPLPPFPSKERLADRAQRVKRKIAEWDREKLETHYVRTLLSAQLLRNSQRMLDRATSVLNGLSQQHSSQKELRKTARLLAMYANMLLKPELARHRGNRKGGLKGSAERKRSAARLHDRWLAAYYKHIEAGGTARNAASTLAPRFNVTPRAFREGIKEARARAERCSTGQREAK